MFLNEAMCSGWAIEGAIGSSHKIDATYLSPHVNLAARLEEATKLYRVPILMSSQFAIELSPAAQTYLRLLDRVTVRVRLLVFRRQNSVNGCCCRWARWSGVQNPWNCTDLMWIGATFPHPLAKIRSTSVPVATATHSTRYNSAFFCSFVLSRLHLVQIVVDFATDPNVAALQASFSDEFFDTFDSGVRAYLDGNWNAARRHLRRVQETHPDDGPTLCLLEYIQEYDAPHDWPGYRALTEK